MLMSLDRNDTIAYFIKLRSLHKYPIYMYIYIYKYNQDKRVLSHTLPDKFTIINDRLSKQSTLIFLFFLFFFLIRH